jgi:trimethylamine--corrinoid protein Co-methyltransferase
MAEGGRVNYEGIINLIPEDISIFPKLSFLSLEDKEKIYRAALHVLENIGMEIQHEGALSLLLNAGCSVKTGRMVTIPKALVERSIQSAPDAISVFNRNGRKSMDLGGNRSYFGTGSDLIYSLNPSGERRLCILDDVCRAARLCDALSNIDFIMSFAHPNDVDPARAYLVEFQAMAENSVKPIVCTAECKKDLAKIWELSRKLRGSEAALREKPYFIHYAEPISPLKHPFDSLDKLLFCAEKHIPAIYSPAPIAGSTAPMTIAGHVVQGLGECFCGLVIHQLASPGAPFIMGMGAAVLDMATSQCSYNAPEYYMAYMAMIEMSHHVNLPSWGYAGTSDAQIPDGQAGFEAGLLTFMSAMAGANLNHDVGYLDFGRTGSLEMIVIVDEMIDLIRRMKKGIPIDGQTLALDVIQEVGPAGEYLSHEHTFKHLRSTQWRPKLISRSGYEEWEASGKMTLLDRARIKLDAILQTHHPEPIPDNLRQEIHAITNRYNG